MGLTAVQCTQCGAHITIDETKDTHTCDYCKTTFLLPSKTPAGSSNQTTSTNTTTTTTTFTYTANTASYAPPDTPPDIKRTPLWLSFVLVLLLFFAPHISLIIMWAAEAWSRTARTILTLICAALTAVVIAVGIHETEATMISAPQDQPALVFSEPASDKERAAGTDQLFEPLLDGADASYHAISRLVETDAADESDRYQAAEEHNRMLGEYQAILIDADEKGAAAYKEALNNYIIQLQVAAYHTKTYAGTGDEPALAAARKTLETIPTYRDAVISARTEFLTGFGTYTPEEIDEIPALSEL